MPDIFTTTSSQSWFGRIGNSFMGIVFGLLFVTGSVILLGWNEKRAVTTANSLTEGAKAVVSVSPGEVAPANEQKLIHLSGRVDTSEPLRDPDFGVEAVALRLKRHVEMYQWKEQKVTEKRSKVGGGEETTTRYEYTKDWSENLIPSRDFMHPEDHTNPPAMALSSRTLTAPKAALGAFQIPSFVIEKMGGDEGLPLGDSAASKVSPEFKSRCKKVSDTLYLGIDPNAPQVGDSRINFLIVRPGDFSVLARQAGSSIDRYPTRAGDSLLRIESGSVSAAEMFEHAQSENTAITWVARLGGFIFMWVGCSMILSPLKVIADVIPFVGSIVGAGTALISAVISLVVSLAVIALAWLAVRPFIGGTLLVVALAALIFGLKHVRQRAIAAAPSR
jgi:hypothetical protein